MSLMAIETSLSGIVLGASVIFMVFAVAKLLMGQFATASFAGGVATFAVGCAYLPGVAVPTDTSIMVVRFNLESFFSWLGVAFYHFVGTPGWLLWFIAAGTLVLLSMVLLAIEMVRYYRATGSVVWAGYSPDAEIRQMRRDMRRDRFEGKPHGMSDRQWLRQVKRQRRADAQTRTTRAGDGHGFFGLHD